MKKILYGVFGVALVGIVLVFSLRNRNGTGLPVETVAVAPRTVVAKVKASGNISPRKKVEIQAKVIGEIVALPFREGDAVRAGEVVVEIEKKLYQAACDQARAALEQARVQLERAQAELANAQLEFDRVEQLFAQEVVPQQRRDQARLALQQAQVAVRAQQRAIEQATFAYRRALEDLDRTTIRSPMDGVVISRRAEVGETAIMGTTNFPGSVLMVIGDLSELVAEVEVPERDVVQLALGQQADVRVDALPDESFAGRVVEIASSGNKIGDVVKFKVKVALDVPDRRLKPEMTAKVEITTLRAENVLAVPQQAVQTRSLDEKGREVFGKATGREVEVVYLLENGKAVRREVKTGVQDELFVEVREGLREGDLVITGPYKTLRTLKDGDAVRQEKTGKKA
ncbi:MAG: efflux RND transporter periplasmic adaptor subunit [Thermoanaerobaculum sp.]|nr:efflux RND transporter periplasmic adaptor subunit [Thermoanaerobaculum sp.]MDW7967627.1 efflux RND transporter periplasmic adaptor subunit [Thermoanaerobaculum sp.]